MNQDQLLPLGSHCQFLSGVNPKKDEWMHGIIVEWDMRSASLMPNLVKTHYRIRVSPVHSEWPRIVYRRYEDVKPA